MKMLIKYFTIASVLITTIACSNKDDNKVTPTQNMLSMKVNNVDWVADSALRGHLNTTTNIMMLIGRKNEDQFVVNLTDITGVGTFNIVPNGSRVFAYRKENGITDLIYAFNPFFHQSHASITITKINPGIPNENNIEGNFSAVIYRNATDSVVITDGVFKFD